VFPHLASRYGAPRSSAHPQALRRGCTARLGALTVEVTVDPAFSFYSVSRGLTPGASFRSSGGATKSHL